MKTVRQAIWGPATQSRQYTPPTPHPNSRLTKIFHQYNIPVLQLRARNRDTFIIHHSAPIALGNPQPINGEFGFGSYPGVEVCGAALDVDACFLGEGTDGFAAGLDAQGDGFGGHGVAGERRWEVAE